MNQDKLFIAGVWYDLVPSKDSSDSVGEKRGWEIVKMIASNGEIHDLVEDTDDTRISNCVSGGCKIYSVRRLSDGEAFSVGEDIFYFLGEEYSGKIEKFEMFERHLFVSGNPLNFYIPLSSLKKRAPIPEPKKPLFTTEDGRPAYKGDVVYLLYFESWSLTQVVAAHSPLVGHEKEYKYFSTEKSAIEFIVMNKPVFSLKDIMNELVSETTGRSTLLWKEKNKLTQLAKSKINNDGGK